VNRYGVPLLSLLPSPVAMLHDMVRKPPKKDASETRPTQTMAHFGGIGIMSPYFPYFPILSPDIPVRFIQAPHIPCLETTMTNTSTTYHKGHQR
jgi:hypothetical protein